MTESPGPRKGSESFKPGGAKLGRLNYSLSDRTFAHHDIPQRARAARTEVQNYAKGDILGLARTPWDTSVAVERPKRRMTRENFRFQSVAPVYNFRAEVLPRDDTPYQHKGDKLHMDETIFLGRNDKTTIQGQRPNMTTQRLGEMSVNPRLSEFAPWDISMEPMTHVERQRLIDDLDQHALKATKKKRDIASSQGRGTPSLVDRHTAARQQQRDLKMKEREMKRLEEEMGATTHSRKANRKPKLVSKQRRRIVKKWYHTGSFQYSPIEEAEVWSCCMSGKESEGCQCETTDLDSWNLGPVDY